MSIIKPTIIYIENMYELKVSFTRVQSLDGEIFQDFPTEEEARRYIADLDSKMCITVKEVA